MKIDIKYNGSITLQLISDDAVESLILTEMASGAQRGKKVTLSAIPDLTGAVQISVDKN